MRQARLHGSVQVARDDLGVDWVGDARRPAGVLRYQPQVPQVEEVFLRPRLLVRAGQDRPDHPPHSFLAQLVRELVDVRIAPQDQPLLGRQDVLAR